jgi:hypothetical protein
MHKLGALQGVVRTFAAKATSCNFLQLWHQQIKELVPGGLIACMPLTQQGRDVWRVN